MQRLDLNQLVLLDVLLTEESVAGAARRLRLSASAMSRALARLREATGDPLLVRAGGQLVPTPRALALRDRVHLLVQEGEALLGAQAPLDLARLQRTFTLRVGDGFVEGFGAALLERIASEAPDVVLRFVPKPDKDSDALREGRVDLETGVVGRGAGPELRMQALWRDRFVGVVRPGHPLCDGPVTPERFAAGRHIIVARRGHPHPVDDALQPLGLARTAASIVTMFAPALALVRTTDLIATVPEHSTTRLREGLHTFTLPVETPTLTVSMIWHPRQEADAAHRWLRGVVRDVCAVPA
jgi:DNA-binding transcriptional LysR family regulator